MHQHLPSVSERWAAIAGPRAAKTAPMTLTHQLLLRQGRPDEAAPSLDTARAGQHASSGEGDGLHFGDFGVCKGCRRVEGAVGASVCSSCLPHRLLRCQIVRLPSQQHSWDVPKAVVEVYNHGSE